MMSNLHNLGSLGVAIAIGVFGVVGAIVVTVISISLKVQPVIAILSFLERVWTRLRAKFHPRPSVPAKSSTQLEIKDKAQLHDSMIVSPGRDFNGRTFLNSPQTTYNQGMRPAQVKSLLREMLSRLPGIQPYVTPRTRRTKKPAKSVQFTVSSQDHHSEESISQEPEMETSEGNLSVDAQIFIREQASEQPYQEPSEQDDDSAPDNTNVPLSEGVVVIESGPHLEAEIGEAQAGKDTIAPQIFEGEEVPDEYSHPQQEGSNAYGIGIEDALKHERNEEELNNTVPSDSQTRTGDQIYDNSIEESTTDVAATNEVSASSEADEAISARQYETAATDIEPLVKPQRPEANANVGESLSLPTISRDDTVGDTPLEYPTFSTPLDDEDQPEIPIPLPQREDGSESKNPIDQVLNNYTLEEIGFALKRRRIAVDIKQADISYDRGWVMMLEHGEWRTSDYKRDPMLLEKLRRYLYVVGWSVDRLHEQLMKTQIAQPDVETSIEG